MALEQPVLSASDLSAYEKLPAPMCVLKNFQGIWRIELVSDGLCRMIGKSRESLPDDPLECVLAVDRELARNTWEYAAIYPGEESRSSYRILKYPAGELNVSCRASSRRSPNGTILLFLFYTELESQDPSEQAAVTIGAARADVYAAGKNSGNYRIAKWHIDLTRDKTLSYTPSCGRAVQIPKEIPYSKAAPILGNAPSSESDRRRLSDILNRENLLHRYQDGETNFSLEYRRDEDGKMPFWVLTSVSTFQSVSSGNLECFLSSYDITEQILEKQILSRLTMLGYEVVGLIYVHTGKCRFFRIKKLHLGMDYEQYVDYQDSIDESLESVISPDQRESIRKNLLLETIQERLKEASIYPFSYSMVRSDGRHLQKLLQFSYLDEQKDTIFLCKSDITKQYRNEHV